MRIMRIHNDWALICRLECSEKTQVGVCIPKVHFLERKMAESNLFYDIDICNAVSR